MGQICIRIYQSSSTICLDISDIYLNSRSFLPFKNSVDPDELQLCAAFIWVSTVCKSTHLGVSHIQTVAKTKWGKCINSLTASRKLCRACCLQQLIHHFDNIMILACMQTVWPQVRRLQLEPSDLGGATLFAILASEIQSR